MAENKIIGYALCRSWASSLELIKVIGVGKVRLTGLEENEWNGRKTTRRTSVDKRKMIAAFETPEELRAAADTYISICNSFDPKFAELEKATQDLRDEREVAQDAAMAVAPGRIELPEA